MQRMRRLAYAILDSTLIPIDRVRDQKPYYSSVRTPFNRHRHRPKLSRLQRAVNRSHARIRARGERAITTLKTWKILPKPRCPRRATTIVQAILVLHHIETSPYSA